MIEEYKKQIYFNNNQITQLKETIKKFYQKETKIIPYDINDISGKEELEKIIESQTKDIAILNIIVDTEDQKLTNELNRRIEKLKETESDKNFSEYYRNGIVEINGIDVSVDRFYIKEVETNNKSIFNFICTDKRIDKKIFGTIDDKEYIVKNIYKLKNSMIFYQMYLDKNLFINDKITINNKQQLNLFMQYIHNCTPEKHKMVAETMID